MGLPMLWGLEHAPSEVGVCEPDSPQPGEPKSHPLPCSPHTSIGARPRVEMRYEDRDECPVGVNQLHAHPSCSSGLRLEIPPRRSIPSVPLSGALHTCDAKHIAHFAISCIGEAAAFYPPKSFFAGVPISRIRHRCSQRRAHSEEPKDADCNFCRAENSWRSIRCSLWSSINSRGLKVQAQGAI